MIHGCNNPLYILPFDHRGSFEKGLFGWRGTLTLAETTIIEAMKQIIYEGFKAAISAGVSKEKACLLVDEQFGGAVLSDAVGRGYTVAYPVEKGSVDEFDFEYGEDFRSHIEAIQPTFCKVSICYNPEAGKAFNLGQMARLRRLADYLRGEPRTRFLVDLLVPAESEQLKMVDGDIRTWNSKIRPRLVVRAIEELQNADIEPDVWMIEGFDSREDCERVVSVVRYEGRDRVGCVVAGHREDDEKVRQWLRIAAPVPGFIGFSLGHDFWEPLWRWRAKRDSREVAIAEIARRYKDFADFYERARNESFD